MEVDGIQLCCRTLIASPISSLLVKHNLLFCHYLIRMVRNRPYNMLKLLWVLAPFLSQLENCSCLLQCWFTGLKSHTRQLQRYAFFTTTIFFKERHKGEMGGCGLHAAEGSNPDHCAEVEFIFYFYDDDKTSYQYLCSVPEICRGSECRLLDTRRKSWPACSWWGTTSTISLPLNLCSLAGGAARSEIIDPCAACERAGCLILPFLSSYN